MKYPGPHRSQVGRVRDSLSPSTLYIALTPFSSLCFFGFFPFSAFFTGAAASAGASVDGAADGSSFFGAGGFAGGIMHSPLP